MPAASYPKIDGSVQTLFHFGGPAGPSIRSTGGVLEARDPTNAGFAILRGLTPAAANDLATKNYVDTNSGAPIVGTSKQSGTFTENAGTYTDIVAASVVTTAAKPNVLAIASASGTAINGVTAAQALFRLMVAGAPFNVTGFGFSSSVVAAVTSVMSGSLSYVFANLGGTPGTYAFSLQGRIVTPGTLTIAIGSEGNGASLQLIPF